MKKFPTLADVRKQAGKKGLLNPNLRKGTTGKVPTVKQIFGK